MGSALPCPHSLFERGTATLAVKAIGRQRMTAPGVLSGKLGRSGFPRHSTPTNPKLLMTHQASIDGTLVLTVLVVKTVGNEMLELHNKMR